MREDVDDVVRIMTQVIAALVQPHTLYTHTHSLSLSHSFIHIYSYPRSFLRIARYVHENVELSAQVEDLRKQLDQSDTRIRELVGSNPSDPRTFHRSRLLPSVG